MLINIIVATDLNGAIGAGNKLPWHLPKELARFKELTMNSTVIMGRKTYESMPFYPKGLPGRNNVIISRTLKEVPGCTVVDSLDTYMRYLKLSNSKETVWVIGGGEIYKEAIKYSTGIYLTVVETEVKDADTFFKIPEEDLVHFTKFSDTAFSDDVLLYRVKVYVRNTPL